MSSFHRFFHDKPFLTSFIITFALVSASLVLFRPYFYNIDDSLILLLLKGIGIASTPSEMVQHENVLLCRILAHLYKIFPHYQWYSGLQVLTLFLSFWAILASLLLGTHRLFKTVLFVLSSLAMIFFFFSSLQWTQTASLAAISAFFLLTSLWSGENSRHRYKIFTLAFVLILFSIMLRFASFSLILLTSIPSVIYLTWKKEVTPIRMSIIRYLACMAAIVLAAISYHHYVYQSDSAWADYLQFEGPRTQLSDFQDPAYNETTKPFFDSIGWIKNDLYMFQCCIYMDKDIYTYDKLKKIADYFPRIAFNKHKDTSPLAVFSNKSVQTAVVFFLAFLVYLPKRLRRLALINSVWVFFILLFLMFYLKIPERVCLPPILFIMYMNLFGAQPLAQEALTGRTPVFLGSKKKLSLIILSFLFSFLLILSIYSNNLQKIQETGILNESLNGFHPQENQLYVNLLSSFPFELIPAFDDFEVLRNINFIQLSWDQRSPTTEAMLEKFKIHDLLKDMVDNPNYYLIVYSETRSPTIPNFLSTLQTYMNERYGIDMYLEQSFKCPVFWLIRFHSGKITTNPKLANGRAQVQVIKHR